jgi:uncharacterized protein
MKSQLINSADGQRTFVLIFDPEDEAMDRLLKFAEDNQVTAAQFTGIGAFETLTVGYFDPDKKDYLKTRIPEQVEVLSLVGNIARYEGKPKVHAHVVVGKRDGTAHGGHLVEGRVRPTLEIVAVEAPAYLHREFRPSLGLALLNVAESR